MYKTPTAGCVLPMPRGVTPSQGEGHPSQLDTPPQLDKQLYTHFLLVLRVFSAINYTRICN